MILSACHFYKKPLDLKFKRDLGQKSDNFSKMLPLNPEQALQTAETEATDEEVTAPEAANNTNSSETAIFSEKTDLVSLLILAKKLHLAQKLYLVRILLLVKLINP